MAKDIQKKILEFLDDYALRIKDYVDHAQLYEHKFRDDAKRQTRKDLKGMGLQPAMLEYLVLRGQQLKESYGND
ncbi:MAG: hypothetical protein ACMXYL_04260 [Candidatus Woesearchaeota archaeon]